MRGRLVHPALVLIATYAIGAAVCSASVYSELQAEFTQGEHRLPGSANFDRCLDALARRLRDAGLEPHVQTFDTLAPRTEWCRLSIEGGPDVPVFPLDNGVAPLVTDGAIRGRLLWLGDGSLEAMRGKDVEGTIALLDFDAPGVTVADVFSHGARAVVFVGGGKATQWNVAKICYGGPVTVPRLYVDRETAAKLGLLTAEGRMASLDAKVRLVDAVARNLWVEIPGKVGTEFRLGREEAVILSATLDTFGVVPDRCPQVRGAANAALLADVACGLAGSAPKRSLFFVFFGSHYAAQEGARTFHYAVGRAGEDGDDSLSFRARKYGEEHDRVGRLLAACERTDLFARGDDEARALTRRIKDKLVSSVSTLNAELREIRLEQQRLEKFSREGAETGERIAQLKERASRMTGRKGRWNRLRGQITEGLLRQEDPASREAFDEVVQVVRADLSLRSEELDRMIAHNRTFQALAERFRDKIVVGHFDLDFANDRDPWLFSVIGDFDLFLRYGERLDLGSFLMHLAELGEVYADIRDPAWRAPLFADALHPFYKPFSLCVPVQRSVPSTVAVMMGFPGYQLMTVGATLDRDELPVREECDLSGLIPQVTALAAAMADREELSLRHPFKKAEPDRTLTSLYRKGDLVDGLRFVNYSKGSTDVEGPAHRAVAVIAAEGGAQIQLAGVRRDAVARINGDGYVFMPMLHRGIRRAFGYDPAGRLNRFSMSGPAVDPLRLPLFYGYGGGAFSFGFAPDPPESELYRARPPPARTLSAKTEGAHRVFCDLGLPPLRAYYADREGRIKRIGRNGELVLGATEDRPTGAGVPLDPRALLALDGIRRGAEDHWLLNESRLHVLRMRNIVNDALESLHAEAREHLDDARQAREDRNHAAARAHHIFATCLENRVHGPLKGITNDLVKAVVVLLLLNIPFAFVMERLVFGSTSIYRQVAGFAGIFVATFVVLYFTHPAFSLAAAPLIIFLAFVIILLSGVTVTIVLGKIRGEIRMIQGLGSRVHGVESDTNTALAAVLIGVSGMRNRPLKTFLTAATVVLLTFTILVFASFTSRLGVVESYLGKGQDEDRIELHRFPYLDISPELVRSVERLYAGEYRVFRRGGLFRDPTKVFSVGVTPRSAEPVVYNPATGKTAAFGAVLGLDPQETEVNEKMRRLVPEFREKTWTHPPLYLPAAAAAKLGVRKGDAVKLIGHVFTYAGPFDLSALRDLVTIDDTKIVPPDFASTVRNIGEGTGLDRTTPEVRQMEEADIGSFEWFSPGQIAITDLRVLRRRFRPITNINFISLYPRRDDVDIEKAGRKLASVFQGAVHVKSAEGAKKLFFTRAVAGSGFGDVIVPLLLGGLIIFSSLMGSIVDREREIFTYSALGLSPPDVGALFFAESSVYSVVGGMGGYLLSQVVAKVMVLLGSRGYFTAPEMNFSSLSSVLTILIVMAVVMLSTIVPASKAGKSANPGVARKWRMPAAEGDRLRFVLPFTVSDANFAGILSFVKEHFENHGDATLGNFAARDVHLFNEMEGRRLGIRANISLAPFDLGIFQDFRMVSRESDIEGIDEVVVELERIGGAPHAWARGNRAFVDELREQFLFWRSLPIETVEHYKKETQRALGNAVGQDGNE